MGTLATELARIGFSPVSSYDPVFRVRRCYNAGSKQELAFQSAMARIVYAYRHGHITERQAKTLAESL